LLPAWRTENIEPFDSLPSLPAQLLAKRQAAGSVNEAGAWMNPETGAALAKGQHRS
jgi:hypothetical protein